jgi:hypothetical protein
MATPGKGTKRPTGEMPKRNSALAKFITGGYDKLTPAQARTAAGLYRDMEKAMGGFGKHGAMDKSGATLGKAIKQTQAQTARADKAKQDAMKKKNIKKALGATPAGMGLKIAGKVAGAYATGAKQIAKTVKDKVSPPKKNMKSGGKALTPAQLAKLKKMLSGRLDK